MAVSWCTPPALFPRSIQVARLFKGLKRQGWTTTVVTPRTPPLSKANPQDPSLEEFYAGEYQPVRVDLSRIDPDAIGWLDRRKLRVRREAQLSDDLLWARRAADTVRALIREEPPDVLVTFAQPWRDHLVGLELLRWGKRLPWVAHFSDPWVDNLYDADLPDETQAEERRREARVVERADLAVFTNRYAADLVMAKYPAAWRGKVRIVPHATDDDLTAVVDRTFPRRLANASTLRLTHVGNLFAGRRTADSVFDALSILNQRRPLQHRLELVILGEGSGLYDARAKAFMLNLDSVVTFRPRVSYLESVAAMRDSDVLLLIDAPADINVFFPSKLVDYLMARRPILALTPAIGVTADIMTQLGYPAVEPGNVNAIVASIDELLARHAAGPLQPSAAAATGAAPYSLDATARAFAAVLDEACSS